MDNGEKGEIMEKIKKKEEERGAVLLGRIRNRRDEMKRERTANESDIRRTDNV